MTRIRLGERGSHPAALSDPSSIEDASRFLDALFADVPPEHYVVLYTKPGNGSRFFPVTRLTDAADDAIRRSHTRDVYIGCGLRRCDLGPTRRGGVEDVVGVIGFWVDLDIVKPGASRAYFPSFDALTMFIRGLPVAPTIVVATGGGVHAWWLFKEPWCFADSDDRERAAFLLQGWQRMLMARANTAGVAIDATFDLARVLRVPGTINHKHRVAVTILVAEGPRIDPGDVEPFIQSVGVTASSMRAPSGPYNASFVLRMAAEPPTDKFSALYTNDPRFRHTWDHRRADLRDQSPSAYDQSLASAAVGVGWSDQEIVDLLIAHRRHHDAPLKLRPDYYARTLARARTRADGTITHRNGLTLRPVTASAATMLGALARSPIEKIR